MLDCKIYRLMEVELQTTQDFIKDKLAKGYIEESNSPYASPLFYQAKKDGKLHPIMDYKALNSWTIRDTYPLPLILYKKESQVKSEKTAFSQQKSTKSQYFLTFP